MKTLDEWWEAQKKVEVPPTTSKGAPVFSDEEGTTLIGDVAYVQDGQAVIQWSRGVELDSVPHRLVPKRARRRDGSEAIIWLYLPPGTRASVPVQLAVAPSSPDAIVAAIDRLTVAVRDGFASLNEAVLSLRRGDQ